MELLGPVFSFDLLRLSRRKRFFVLRFAFCLLLFLTLALCYWAFVERLKMLAAGGALVGGRFYSSGRTPGDYSQILARESALFAFGFFVFFVLFEFGLILLVAPAIVAGTLVEEKQKQTLEYLLATDLTNREIVLGKLLSRLLVLAGLVLGGYAILAITQFLGGIDARLLFLSLGMVACSLLSVSAISLFCSVKAERLRGALAGAYLIQLLLFLAWLLPYFLLQQFRSRWGTGTVAALEAWASGAKFLNPISLLVALLEELNVSGQFGSFAVNASLAFCAIHLLIGLLFALLATERLRSAHLAQQMATTRAATRLRTRPRPKVWPKAPLAWKELTGGRSRAGRWLWLAALVATLCWLGPWAWTIVRTGAAAREALAARGMRWSFQLHPSALAFHLQSQKVAPATYALIMKHAEAALDLREQLPWFVLIPAALALMMVGVRAASGIAQERDQQTWDGLLAAPLALRDILRAKWLGAVALAWPFVFYVTAILALGAVCEVVPGASAAMGVLALSVYVGFMGALGLFFSVISASALRATLGALVVLALMAATPLVVLAMMPRLSGAEDLATGMVALLDVLEWSWVLALAAVGAAAVGKFAPAPWGSSLLLFVKVVCIGLPLLLVGLMLMFVFAVAFNLHFSVGELCAFLSPLYVLVMCSGQETWRVSAAETQAGTAGVVALYAGAGFILWGLARWRLGKGCGRVDGKKPGAQPRRLKGAALTARLGGAGRRE